MENILKKIDDSGRINLSKEIREDFHINKGELVNVEIDKDSNRVIISKN